VQSVLIYGSSLGAIGTKILPVAVLMIASSAICFWKGNESGITKSFGIQLESVAGTSKFKMASGSHFVLLSCL